MFRISFYKQISDSYNFLELHPTLSEKDFCSKFYFFNRFTQTSHLLNSQNLLSVTKVFRKFSPKSLLNCFLKYLWAKSWKIVFYVSVVNCYCACIFKGSNYRFSGVPCRKYFKNSYFSTSISNYLYIESLLVNRIKSRESFCLSILTICTDNWSTF